MLRTIWLQRNSAGECGVHNLRSSVLAQESFCNYGANDGAVDVPSLLIKEGDTVQLRAQQLPTGKWALQLLHTGSFAGQEAHPAGLPNALAWWGWVAGPLLLVAFYLVSLWTSTMLASVYR